MKISMIMVMSMDGVIAKDADHHAFLWTSPEDKKHFVKLSKKIGAVLMGGNTYKASGVKNYKDRKGFVLTNHPQKYDLGEDMFVVNGSPEDVYRQIEQLGVKNLALIGGAQANLLFLKANLVDDIYLTIEPKIFGKGIHIADLEDLDVKLKLESIEKLNNQGTLLLHYSILKH